MTYSYDQAQFPKHIIYLGMNGLTIYVIYDNLFREGEKMNPGSKHKI